MLSSLRRALLAGLGIVLLVLPAGCQRDHQHKQAGASAPAAPPAADVVNAPSMAAAIDRFQREDPPSPADSAALHRRADSLRHTGSSIQGETPDRARDSLRHALRAYRLLADSAGRAESMREIGGTHRYQSQYEAAMARYDSSLALFRKLDHQKGIASTLKNIGIMYRKQGRYENALSHYREALAIRRKLGDRKGIASTLNNIGLVFWNQDRYDRALARYEESLAIKRELGDREGIASTLNNMGLVLWNQGEYDRAVTRYEASLRIKRELGDREGMASTLNNLGIILWKQGKYDRAAARYEESLAIKREMGAREGVSRAFNNIGLVYKDQGQYDRALSYYERSLAIKREINYPEGTARTLSNAGNVYRMRSQYEKALARYEKSLAIKRKIGDRDGAARTLKNIGSLHRKQGEYEEALSRYEKSLGIYRDIGSREGIANNWTQIGTTRRMQGQHDEALSAFRRSLQIERSIDNRKDIATDLDHIGDMYLAQGRLQAATDTLGRAVRLAETLRRSATSPAARRSLLSTQISVYRALTTAHVRSGRPDSALRAVEQARARLLADQLAGTARTDTVFSVPPPDELRRTLGAKEAALLYANPGPERPLTALVVTADTTYAQELPERRIRADLEARHGDPFAQMQEERGLLRAALAGSSRKQANPEDGRPTLAEAIRLYRSRLTEEDETDSLQHTLARKLHNLLIAPVEPHLRDENTITVVPTGALGYLPFEALRDANGRYLVQKKQVRYAQSLTVLRQLRERTYPSDRRPLLAVGGAVYGGPAPSGDGLLLAEARRSGAGVESEATARTLYRSAEKQLERGRSPRATYAKLGYGQWPALYGTQLEVQKLRRALGPETTLLTGTDASEERIRRMSISGELAEYRQVHFATHGMAVPEAPSLSALVLSQEGVSDSLASNDGYLTMGEIAGLEMQADVAVLSACRTGLGRIIAGEGVVSLSHAFLRAGANATLVSQWRVLDWSTQQFMTRVYREARSEETTFAEAVTEVKRSFIAGDFGPRNADPLRWAPFVYYGRR